MGVLHNTVFLPESYFQIFRTEQKIPKTIQIIALCKTLYLHLV